MTGNVQILITHEAELVPSEVSLRIAGIQFSQLYPVKRMFRGIGRKIRSTY